MELGGQHSGDPFIGNTSNPLHTKQGSGDSGLGGMGSNAYNMNRTPNEPEYMDDSMDDGRSMYHIPCCVHDWLLNL